MDGNTAVDNKTRVVQQFSAESCSMIQLWSRYLLSIAFLWEKEYLHSNKRFSGKGGFIIYNL